EAVPLQYVADGGTLRQRPIGMFFGKDLQQLFRAPIGVAASSLKNRFDDLRRRCIGARLRSTSTVTETAWAFCSVTVYPLVAGLAADAVAVAELRDRQGAAQ